MSGAASGEFEYLHVGGAVWPGARTPNRSTTVTQCIDQQGEGRRGLAAAGVVEVAARVRRTPIGERPDEAPVGAVRLHTDCFGGSGGMWGCAGCEPSGRDLSTAAGLALLGSSGGDAEFATLAGVGACRHPSPAPLSLPLTPCPLPLTLLV